ncbi:mitochondrial fission protein ELM1 isoform X2 [Rhodamnia argentea]|uniref:Mitochondrial fission protein ELM1 isoform X2 n=1 Tax=Rhodamnia argentea TaxID=178133 RepID=A0ABM3HKI5_9MYRT|nr:mitochondrial fission protein ELM1 isoform X2 [Rhodamnia argentea]
MKPIRLPEPPSPTPGVPEIFEGGTYSVVRRAVVIGNGSTWSENQSIGLVRALGLSDKHVLYRVTRPKGGVNEWLHWLPVSVHKKLYFVLRRIFGYTQLLLTARGRKHVPVHPENGGNVGLSSILEADAKQIVKMARETYEKDGPLLVVASGRDTISVASSIKRLASENVFVVQAQEQVPRFLKRWLTPQEPPDEHVVLTVGALHQIDSAALRNAASAWNDEFAPLPKPLLVVNIGGPTSQCRYGADLAKKLISNLLSVLASCGTVRISFSSRTPDKVSSIIVKQLGDNPKVFIWDGQEPNPHMGHLAWADAFVVTADSISIISEACSTGKPVYVMGAERCTWKYADFHKCLRERGVVRPFLGSEDILESWSYPPLNDTAEAASRVREALAERGWRLRT